MIDWNLAIKVFGSGISIVMLVMLILQITVNASSMAVRSIEKRVAKVENKG